MFFKMRFGRALFVKDITVCNLLPSLGGADYFVARRAARLMVIITIKNCAVCDGAFFQPENLFR
jgi:hypothetical protein